MLKKYTLIFVQFLLHLKDCLSCCWLRCKSLFLTSCRRPRSHRDIIRDSKRLKKLPLHISFAVTENEIDYRDLACLIVWSVSLGISCISLYDYRGLIKANRERLRTEVYRKQEVVMGEEAGKYSIHFYDPSCCREGRTWSGENGEVVVCLLCVDDGRQAVSETARRVCSSVQSRRLCLEEFTATDLEREMALAAHGIVDPDMMVQLGPASCLIGYPPWLLRLTEIRSLYTHHNVNYKSFLATIETFANCERRLGK